MNRLRGPKVSDIGCFQETVGRNSLVWVFVPLIEIFRFKYVLFIIYEFYFISVFEGFMYRKYYRIRMG